MRPSITKPNDVFDAILLKKKYMDKFEKAEIALAQYQIDVGIYSNDNLTYIQHKIHNKINGKEISKKNNKTHEFNRFRKEFIPDPVDIKSLLA